MAITYILDDASSLYNGRKVVMVRFGEGMTRVVRVVGTSIQMVVHLRNLAAA